MTCSSETASEQELAEAHVHAKNGLVFFFLSALHYLIKVKFCYLIKFPYFKSLIDHGKMHKKCVLRNKTSESLSIVLGAF